MTQVETIHVVVVDDHPIMLEGIRDALETCDHIEVVALAGSGEEAIEAARRLRPTVIVMDAIMPGLDGLDACRAITDELPDTRVLILTAATTEDLVLDAVACGARGYVQKVIEPRELVQAVCDIADGELRIPESAIQLLFEEIRTTRVHTARQLLSSLTDRERDVLALYAQGMSYGEIADERENSNVTVRNTIYRIQEKVGVKSRQELVVWAVRSGLLES